MEVTFEEARRHLGMETQRQWSDLAIQRTTPVLRGLFSLVMLLADRCRGDGSGMLRQATWYRKAVPTFADALALVRREIWAQEAFCTSRCCPDMVNSHARWSSASPRRGVTSLEGRKSSLVMGVNGNSDSERKRQDEENIMDAETRLERKIAAKDRRYTLRSRPKQVGRSVFTIQQVQAKRAEQGKGGRVEKPSRSHGLALPTIHCH